jgi:uracil-DNA glycosylase family 4
MSSEILPVINNKLGCTNCPLNEVRGIHKILGKVRGRKIFIWAQSPGPQENKKRRELIGPSGEFLWYELEKVHITRDMCDIQNTVRCMPADINPNIYPSLRMRPPTKEEIKCCSIYNTQALDKCKARLHLVFGNIAGQAILGRELQKEKRVFYSDKLKSWVVYLDHPAYFIRMGYSAGSENPPNQALLRFRRDLQHAYKLFKNPSTDRFQFLKDQNYIGITTRKEAYKAYRRLKRDAAKGIRLVADMEEGRINKHGEPDDDGKTVALCCGFASRPGTSYTFALSHPDTKISGRCRILNKKLVRRLLRDRNASQSFHYGAYDTDAIKRLLYEDVRGFDYDTLIGEFFRDPNARAYGLAAIADRRYPDFMGYKDIRYPEAFTYDYSKKVEGKKLSVSQKVDAADKIGKMNLARLPWKKMVLYNGADCHLEKLVEQDTVKYVNMPLMGVYVDSGQILYRMQNDTNCRPRFDYDWYDRIIPLMTGRIKKYKKQVRKLVGGKYIMFPKKKKVDGKELFVKVKTKFNPGSPGQIYWLLYEKLKYNQIAEHNDTRAGTIRLLAIKHPKLACIYQLREAEKSLSMVESYANCANLNEGSLRTIWKQTGTRTGRISSGKTKERSDDHVINFQNVHGDHLIKCLFVPTTSWRKVYDYWLKRGDFTGKTWKKFRDIKVFMGLDFSQNELRQLAEESGDKNLIKMFSSGADPHVEVGHEITGWPKEEIAKNDRVRKLVKNIQFGLVYGLQGEGLFRFVTQFGVKTTLKEVMKFHAKYHHRFPGVKKLQDYYRNMADKHGYVVNVFGFKRKLTNIGNDEGEGQYFGNIAINSPIQGSAHQLLLMAIAALHRKKEKYKLLKNPWSEAHDSLFFTVKLKNLLKSCIVGQELMTKEPVEIVEKEFKLKKRVPLKAKPKAGFRYGVMIEDVETMTEYQFLNQWCEENKKLEKDFITQQTQ